MEKLIIRTPFRYSGVFSNEACFLHFKDGQANLMSATGKVKATALESILLQCGNYFADLIKHTLPGTMEVFAVHLYPDLLKEMYTHEMPPSFKNNTPKTFPQILADTSIITHFINSLDFYFDNPNFVTPDLLVLKVKELILLLLQTGQANSVAELISQLFTPRQASLKHIIQTHLYVNLSIPELAALSGLSLSSFKREFYKTFAAAPAHYIKVKKLEQAQVLLRNAEFSVSEICYQIGFNDVSHFTKVFKSQFGMKPVDYRKRFRQTAAEPI